MFYDKPKPDLQLIFKDSRYIRCIFFTFVVKMTSLEEKFPGGPLKFAEYHTARFNRDLAWVTAMNYGDLDGAISDIDSAGLIPGEDSFFFDATSPAMYLNKNQKVDLGVDWLAGQVLDNIALAVRLKKGCPE